MTRFEFVRDPESSLALVRSIPRDSRTWEWALSKSTAGFDTHMRREERLGTLFVLIVLLRLAEIGDQPARPLALFAWVAVLLLVFRKRINAALLGLPTVWLASAFLFEEVPWEVKSVRVLSFYLLAVLGYGLFDSWRGRESGNRQLSAEEQELEVNRVVDFAWPYGRGVLAVDGHFFQEEAGGKTRRVNLEDFLEGWATEHGIALAFRDDAFPLLLIPQPNQSLRHALESALGQELSDA